MKRFLFATTLTLLVLSPNSLHASSDALQQVIDSVALHNLQLQALRHSQQADLHDMKADNSLGGPTVEYSPFYQEGFTGVAESELIVSEEFEFPTRYAARHRQIGLEQQVQEQQYVAARRAVLLEAQQLYFDIVRTNQLLAMLHERQHSSESILRMFEKRMEAGDANILELNKVKLDRMDVLTQVSQTENERLRLLQSLQQLNGGIPIAVADTLFPDYTDLTLNPQLSTLNPQLSTLNPQLIDQALAADADILTARADVAAQQQGIAVSRQEWLPNLTVGYRRNTDRGEALHGFVVGASFPLISNRQRVRAAHQRHTAAQLDLQQSQQTARQRLETRYSELLNLQRVLDHSDVTMMRQTLLLLAKALQLGEISALQYYTETDNIYLKLADHIAVHCQSAKLYAELYQWKL